MSSCFEAGDQAERTPHLDNVSTLAEQTCYHEVPTVEEEPRSEFAELSQVEASDKAQNHEKQQSQRIYAMAWQTSAAIIGFYMTALLSAVAHFGFFTYLDGRITARPEKKLPFKVTNLPQSYVTTLSLLLVTVFRAALVASIGVCYAQYLWMVLRRKVFEVKIIEKLFQIRANALRLFNLKLLRQSSTLFLIATISWLIPIATVYPPGAMIVDSVIRQIPGEFNVSTIPRSGGLSHRNANFAYLFPSIEFLDVPENSTVFVIVPQSVPSDQMRGYSEDNMTGQYYYAKPVEPLVKLAKSMLVNAQIPQIQQVSSANASYTLKFPGPMMQCRMENSTKVSFLGKSDYTTSIMTFEDPSDPELNTGQIRYDLKEPIGPLNRLSPSPGSLSLDYTLWDLDGWLTVAPCPRTHISDTGVKYRYELAANITLLWNTHRQECLVSTAEYTVDVAIINGVQHVQYTTGDSYLLPQLKTVDLRADPVPPAPQPLHSWEEYYNIMALIDAMDSSLTYSAHKLDSFFFNQTSVNMTGVHRFEDGSIVDTCVALWTSVDDEESNAIYDISAFAPQPPENNLYLDESLLNEVLGNITVAAISLGMWQDVVQGNVSRVYNIYHFDRRLNFFLPYGLCLLFSLPIVAVGLLALQHNGVSAIDGGFLQILMTTATGDTAIERAARQGSLGGKENVPEDLKRLRVRFGELVTSGTVSDGQQKAPIAKYGANIGESQPEGLDRDATVDEAATVSLLEDHESSESHLEELAQVTKTSGASPHEMYGNLARRAGFGTTEETRPLRRGRDPSLL